MVGSVAVIGSGTIANAVTAAWKGAGLNVTSELVDLAGFDPYSVGTLAESSTLDPGGLLWGSLLTAGDIRARLALIGQSSAGE